MDKYIQGLDGMEVFAKDFLEKLFDMASLGEKGAGGDVGGSSDIKNAGVNQKATVVGLSGDLGSGKTTFSQAVARLLGVNEIVTSPTFVIEKIYKTNNSVFDTFVHIDAYRLESASELENLGFYDLIRSPKTLVFIEWPEKVSAILPASLINIKFEFVDENTRKVLCENF